MLPPITVVRFANSQGEQVGNFMAATQSANGETEMNLAVAGSQEFDILAPMDFAGRRLVRYFTLDCRIYRP